MTIDSHYQNIRSLRRELDKVNTELDRLLAIRCSLRSRLLSEVEGLSAAEHSPIDPGAELAQARERAWGVADA